MNTGIQFNNIVLQWLITIKFQTYVLSFASHLYKFLLVVLAFIITLYILCVLELAWRPLWMLI